MKKAWRTVKRLCRRLYLKLRTEKETSNPMDEMTIFEVQKLATIGMAAYVGNGHLFMVADEDRATEVEKRRCGYGF